MSCAPAQLNVFQSWCGNFLSEVNSLNTVLPNLYDGYRFTWSGGFFILAENSHWGKGRRAIWIRRPQRYGLDEIRQGGGRVKKYPRKKCPRGHLKCMFLP